MKITKNSFKQRKNVFIIAEAGINHNGNISIAKKLIHEASKCGADAIKFQTIIPDELFSKTVSPKLYDFASKLSFDKKEHLELMKYAKKKNIEFFSTPLGKKSTDLLDEIGVKIMKIASGELTNHDFIKVVANKRKLMIISTGMSTIQEIAAAVNVVKEKGCPFILLHCNSSYPTPINEANLSTIPYLKKVFGVPIGYSDHTLGIEACIAAIALGACIIEKHFTLDKKMEGPDQNLSADIKEFSKLVSTIRTVEKAIGIPRIGPTKSEKKFKKLMRKSLAASRDIPNGTKITKSMIMAIRPESGISPTLLEYIVGMKPKRNVKKGTILTWSMF